MSTSSTWTYMSFTQLWLALTPCAMAQEFFHASREVSSPTAPLGVTPAAPFQLAFDADLDGDVDLLTVRSGQGSAPDLIVRLNHGFGNFDSEFVTPVPALDSLYGLGSAGAFGKDFDGDGIPDIVMQGQAGGAERIAYFKGLGSGGFAAPAMLPFFGIPALAALQFDSDPEFELALHGWNLFGNPNPITIFDWSTGAALPLAQSAPIASALYNGRMVAADLTGDGLDDLLLDTAASDGTLTLLPASPTGFSAAVTLPDPLDLGILSGNILGDVDGDGDLDILSSGNGKLGVVKNLGSGPYAPSIVTTLEQVPYPGSSGPYARLFAEDFDGDSILDLVGKLELDAFGSVGSTITCFAYLKGHGDGSFEAPRFLPDGDLAAPVAALDVTGDGQLDLVGARSVVSGLSGFLRANEIQFALNMNAFAPAEDSDRDGDFDVLLAGSLPFSTQQTIFARLVNDGTGHMTQAPTDFGTLPDSATTIGNWIHGADFDADGRTEIIAFLTAPGPVSTSPPVNLGYYRSELAPGLGYGTFQLLVAYTAGMPVVEPPRVLDLNGDGLQDFVNGSSYFLGNGQGAVGAEVALAFGSGMILDAGDFNSDGTLDVLTRSPSAGNGLALQLSSGGGAFTTQPIAQGAVTPSTKSRLLDVDGDGDLDVGVLSNSGFSLGIVENQSGSPGPITEIGLGFAGTGDLAAFDVDLDGKLDLLALQADSDPQTGFQRVTVLPGIPTGFGFAGRTTYVTWPCPTLADADGDGDLDLLGLNTTRCTTIEPPQAGVIRQYGSAFAGSGGATPLLGAQGPLAPGSSTAQIRLVGALGGAPGLLVFATMPDSLDAVPYPGMSLYLANILLFFPITTSGAPGQVADGTFILPVSMPASFAGLTFYHQAFILDLGSPTLLSASNGLELRYGI